jgi:phosphoenolpyruvate carboxylase
LGGEGDAFLEQLVRLEAVVELSEHPVEQVSLGGRVPVPGLPSAAVVRVGAWRGIDRREGPEVAPAWLSRSFFTQRRVMLDFFPEALVTGDAPA